ncbi:ribosome assembly protein 4 [Colletotrichum simmondsii]|uniref:Ribosome assembly protein 4 n=1 Tax=Colletotrichum simmondsii TaxID=703756 RepID=A0A135T411_9PEZI|nr:ribosome assembly protein 4 [Colletotrichum simmondsii]
MSAYLDASNGPPADDSMPSYEEAVAGGAQRNAVRTHSVSGSIQSLNLHDGTLPPSILRLKHLGRAICHNGPVTSIAISPKGYVATSQDNTGTALPSSTKIWDFSQKPGAVGARLVPSDISNDAPVVIFSPDGKLTAVVEKDAGWKRDPDGKKFAAADPLGVVVVFEAATSPPGMPPTKKVAGVMNHAAPTHVLFMPNGADLVTLSRDGTVRISEAKTGRTLRRMEVDGVVTGTGTGARALGVSPDGRVVVSVWARAVYVWEHEAGRVSSWEMNKVRNNEGWPLAVSPDCRFLACRTEEGMDISDVYSGQVLAEVTTAVGIDGLVTAAAFSMDGKMMAVGRHSGVVDVWNLAPYEGL